MLRGRRLMLLGVQIVIIAKRGTTEYIRQHWRQLKKLQSVKVVQKQLARDKEWKIAALHWILI